MGFFNSHAVNLFSNQLSLNIHKILIYFCFQYKVIVEFIFFCFIRRDFMDLELIFFWTYFYVIRGHEGHLNVLNQSQKKIKSILNHVKPRVNQCKSRLNQCKLKKNFKYFKSESNEIYVYVPPGRTSVISYYQNQTK